MDRVKPLLWRHTWISWIFVGLLAITCVILALLQFRWIGEVSKAERQRLHEELTNKLNLLRRSFNEEIESAAAGLLPPASQIEELGREPAYAEQYKRWEPSHERLFRRIALAVPTDGSVELSLLDFDQKSFAKAEWPAEWAWLRERMITRRMGSPVPAPSVEESVMLESPRFAVGPDGGPGGGPPRGGEMRRPPPDRPGGRRGSGRGEKGPPQPNRGPRLPEGRGGPQGQRGDEQEWLVMELNLDYLRSTLFPEMLNRYLGGAGKLEYDAEVVLNSNPSVSLFRSSVKNPNPAEFAADASVRILDIRPNIGRSQPGRGGRGPGPSGDATQGRWLLQVRHHFGSLEAIVARARWRNVAISAGLLLMMLVTVFALLRISRSAQQLAELQMNFVAGVSHELRTPLTVMSTAAYNLRGKIAHNPAQVERYGTLIQEQCTRLTSIVEQVLLFAKSKSGGVLREREPVDLTALIQEELQANRALLEKSGCKLETTIEPGLPIVLGDATALRHAFQNLLTNAIKYGTEGSNWIGVFAAVVEERGGSAVEIRVADRGPGIPREEQTRIFDPFFRGNRALQDQIHGTGLGLNLVKRIVEAHGGSVSVRSEPMQQTEFLIRIPAAPHKIQDEVTHSFN
jgi:signal transduction histidine kinase